MKIVLLAASFVVYSLVEIDGLRIRNPSCTKPIPPGCDKRKVCNQKFCFTGQTCELACGTCRAVCVGQCTPCIASKCRLGYICIADTRKCSTRCCKKECNKDLICATIFCPAGTIVNPDTCSCTCSCKSCVKACPRIYKSVCGTDGKTYANNCILSISTCLSYGRIRKRHNGRCCRKFCPRLYRPVCGTDRKTYANRCLLRIATCRSNGKIKRNHNGRCRRSTPKNG